MAEPVVVRVSELRSAVSRVLDAVEELLGSEVNLATDYFWHLPVEDAFDLTEEPRSFTMGQVSDDVASIREQRDAAPELAWHDLSHLVGVLRALEFAARS